MSEPSPLETHERSFAGGRFGHALYLTCKAFSLFGGCVFVALTAMSLVSIVGRKLFNMPVPGDLELMQMGCAFASAAFLPYCQMIRGHVRVDFFTSKAPPAVKAAMNCVAAILVGLFGAIIAWRAAAGAISVYESGETSTILGWPVWLAQALMVPSFILLAAAGGYIAFDELRGGAGDSTAEKTA